MSKSAAQLLYAPVLVYLLFVRDESALSIVPTIIRNLLQLVDESESEQDRSPLSILGLKYLAWTCFSILLLVSELLQRHLLLAVIGQPRNLSRLHVLSHPVHQADDVPHAGVSLLYQAQQPGVEPALEAAAAVAAHRWVVYSL